MHAKPDLRVLFMLARFPFRLGDHGRYGTKLIINLILSLNAL